ncbi:hypothetical protein L2D01_12445 [Hyphomonadaceae bacterium ML37]|nr:hypothetical protein L2D01_12445 [Hyphomonadaceae bacterium ML37]
MSRAIKAILIGGAAVFALAAYAWSVLAVYVTLGGSVERSNIGGDPLVYLQYFIWYLVGPEIPGVSIPFWLATAASVAAMVFSFNWRRKNGVHPANASRP